MRPFIDRRRFLTIAATAAAFPAMATEQAPIRWRGSALGAAASMQLSGLTEAQAKPVFRAVETELVRLGRIFSLYEPDSEIARLNRDGQIEAPSGELLSVLALTAGLYDATDGAFDPTVQPLWMAMAQESIPADVAEARSKVGWNAVTFDARAIRFARPGMAITLNGIAQGAITDRVATLLRGLGLRDVLIDMGEIAAIGARPDGSAWKVGIAGPDDKVVRQVSLSDRAIATSSPLGTVLDSAGTQGHIVDPTGAFGPARNSLVSVSAPSAALADGLSTAICLLSDRSADRALARYPQARLEYLI